MSLRAACLLFSLTLLGCTTDYPNPFTNLAGTFPPPVGTSLLVISNGGVSTTAPRDLYALGTNGGSPSPLTSCAEQASICDMLEVAPAPDHQHVAVIRNQLTATTLNTLAPTSQGVWVMDLSRAIEGQILTTTVGVDNMQWTTQSSPLLFSAAGTSGFDQVYDSSEDGTTVTNLTAQVTTGTPVLQRHPRFSVNGVIAWEQSAPGQAISQIFGSISGSINSVNTQLTTGDTTLTPTPLSGTLYVVGSDADPCPSPTASLVVFRRLTGLGQTGVGDGGNWDLMQVATDGTGLTPIAADPAYRGAPDWGPNGILFVETPVGSTTTSLILLDNQGVRHTLMSQASFAPLQSPRWLS